jgi:hypothetical protein
MNKEIKAIADSTWQKAIKAIQLVFASLADYKPFDPKRAYAPKELEPFDALADRFVRVVECVLRYFRSYEMLEFAEQSDSTRALLNRMEKLGLVSQAECWLSMRNIRNRNVHDYLPEQTVQMFAEISEVYCTELEMVYKSILVR